MEAHRLQMRLFFFLVLFADVFGEGPFFTEEEYRLLGKMPGLDQLGYGYDARFEDPVAAIRIPVLGWSYTEMKSYVYPLEPRYYKVPDELYVRTVAVTESTSFLFETMDQLKETTSLNIGLSLGNKFQNATKACKPVYNETGNTTVIVGQDCSDFSEEKRSRSLSFGVDVNYVKTNLDQKNTWVAKNAEVTQMFHAFLNPELNFVDGTVKGAAEKLSLLKIEEHPQEFFNFLERFGTHYMVAATLGGKIEMTSLISRNFSNIVTKLAADATLIVSSNSTGNTSAVNSTATSPNATAIDGDISAEEALHASTKHFSNTLNVGAFLGYEKTESNVSYSSSYSWKVLGGDTSLVDLLDTNRSAKAFQDWKETVPGNPVPVIWKLAEISELFRDNTVLRTQLQLAIDLFLSTDTSEIVSLERNPDSGYKPFDKK